MTEYWKCEVEAAGPQKKQARRTSQGKDPRDGTVSRRGPARRGGGCRQEGTGELGGGRRAGGDRWGLEAQACSSGKEAQGEIDTENLEPLRTGGGTFGASGW